MIFINMQYKSLNEQITNMRKIMGLTEEMSPVEKEVWKTGITNDVNSFTENDGESDEFPLDVKMTILSHLSDIQETNPQIRKELNFIKALIMQLAKGKTEMTPAEIEVIRSKWMDQKINEGMLDPIDDKYEKKGEHTTNCRSEIGITVGLVDSLISICRILKPRLKDDEAILGAIADLRDDEDLAAIVNYAPAIDKEKETDGDENA